MCIIFGFEENFIMYVVLSFCFNRDDVRSSMTSEPTSNDLALESYISNVEIIIVVAGLCLTIQCAFFTFPRAGGILRKKSMQP